MAFSRDLVRPSAAGCYRDVFKVDLAVFYLLPNIMVLNVDMLALFMVSRISSQVDCALIVTLDLSRLCKV